MALERCSCGHQNDPNAVFACSKCHAPVGAPKKGMSFGVKIALAVAIFKICQFALSGTHRSSSTKPSESALVKTSSISASARTPSAKVVSMEESHSFDAPALLDREQFSELHRKIDVEEIKFLKKIGHKPGREISSRNDQIAAVGITVASNLRRSTDRKVLQAEIENHSKNLQNPDPLLREVAKFLLVVTQTRLEMLEKRKE